MNGLVISVFAVLAVASAAPSGHIGGAVVVGPAGVVTGLGPVGNGLGWAGPALGLGVGLGHGLGAITSGGGAIGVGAHGAAIRGPPTAPVVVSGPSGSVAADGLWGPTANVGLGHHGHWW